MILQKISIINYKNICNAALDFSPKINCFIGSNGEGKTNLLDAIYFLSFCRSSNNPVDAQIIRHAQDFFMLEGEYLDGGGLERDVVHCAMKRGRKKQMRLNGKAYRRLSEHIGHIPVVMISPSDTMLIDGGGEDRRRLMDVVIAQYDRPYIEALATYGKALQQRNALLKQEAEPEDALMEVLEMQMAEAGTVVFRKRKELVEELTPIFQGIYQDISGNKEEVSLQYISHAQRGDLLEVIRKDRRKDLAVGHSLHGVHRDELEMLLGGYPLRREGSQGQHKTYAIALKLAQFNILKNTRRRTAPILLLDDVFDKLDAHRVEQIVRLVAGDQYGQIFITDTNREHLDSILRHQLTEYKIFAVERGEITEKTEHHV